MKICIVISDYYKDVAQNLLKGSVSELKKMVITTSKLSMFQVHLKFQI